MDKFVAFGFLMFAAGVVGGLVLTDFLWRVKIREKAALGFRLPVFGRLYRVTEDHLP